MLDIIENITYANHNADYRNGFSITASDILEYLFCPRFIYFQNYLDIPQHEEKRFKVQKGRTIHEDKVKLNPQYLRKKLGCVE